WALMRTISASESNVSRPYNVIYGGKTFSDFSRHPDLCVTIIWGPNRGKCSTAAGRYQFISSTWEEMAKRYHPKPPGLFFWQSYSFEPQDQDAVVHAWLSDRYYWKNDIPNLLRQGELDRVLRLLSGTWTSLGYGIETNSMTRHLPQIYREVLQEEIRFAATSYNRKNALALIEYFPKELDKGTVEKALRGLDFPLIIMPAVISDLPSNSIWFSSRVKIDDVKLVAKTLINAGVKIKAIRPFAEGGYFSEKLIRVGADPQMEERSPLTLTQVRQASKFTR
ncbi:MAG: glycoside hydrolase family protein, partial [Okeania sp. SIO2H7]|nr:glycoside hydrolase family protein [Okeania sp. SIO2H7]